MIDLGCCAGLRRGEIASAAREHLIAGPALRVLGKGDRERTIPLPPELAARIASRPAGWLFPSHRRPGRHITAACVGERLALLLGPGATAHSLRHRFATRAYYLGGRDLLATQKLMGHADPETTLAYIEVDLATLLPIVLAAAS
jgi:integrase